MMKVEFNIPYPRGNDWSKRYGFNAYWAGKHYRQRAEDARDWKWIVAAAISQCRVPRRMFTNPVRMIFSWNDRMDLTNHAAMRKMIEDSLKGVLIKDDSRKYVVEVIERFHDEPCIKIQIEEAEI